MIVYSVTVNIEEDVHNNWFDYMKYLHIPEILETGLVKDYKMFRILTRQPDETGVTYNIQYFFDTIEDYYQYQKDYSPSLQQGHAQKFAGKFVAFRTLLEEV